MNNQKVTLQQLMETEFGTLLLGSIPLPYEKGTLHFFNMGANEKARQIMVHEGYHGIRFFVEIKASDSFDRESHINAFRVWFSENKNKGV